MRQPFWLRTPRPRPFAFAGGCAELEPAVLEFQVFDWDIFVSELTVTAKGPPCLAGPWSFFYEKVLVFGFTAVGP